MATMAAQIYDQRAQHGRTASPTAHAFFSRQAGARDLRTATALSGAGLAGGNRRTRFDPADVIHRGRAPT